LAATLREAKRHSKRGIVFTGGTGIQRALYGRLARHLSQRGFHTLTFDYRGMGGSRHDPAAKVDVSMAEWGAKDLPAVMHWMRTTMEIEALGIVGHSTGGQILGLLPEDVSFDAAFLIASQTGYAGYWRGVERLRLLGVWYGLIPLVTGTLGYVPGRLMGPAAEDLPAPVARQWAKWGRHPHYIHSHAVSVGARFAGFEVPVCVLSLDGDDFFAPRAAVDELASWFRRARLERVHIPREPVEPDDEELDPGLGHFGFFGGRGKLHWPLVVEFMDRGLPE
jgi:predicted alpha/beta hydrolase